MGKQDNKTPKYVNSLMEFIEEKGYVPEMFNAYNKIAYDDGIVPCLLANCGFPSGKNSVMLITRIEEDD